MGLVVIYFRKATPEDMHQLFGPLKHHHHHHSLDNVG